MNILVLGNGFDLAHKLPTRYTDFLKWVEAEYELSVLAKKDIFYKAEYVEVVIDGMHSSRKNKVKPAERSFFRQKEIWQCITNNYWIEFFFQYFSPNNNWIDFEGIIGDIIKDIDEGVRKKHFYALVENLTYGYFNRKISDYNKKNGKKRFNDRTEQMNYKKLRDILLSDLNRLIRALEIYLCEAVEEKGVYWRLPDIEYIHIDKVLSFNYTDTYRRIYDPEGTVEYDFIHGKLNTEWNAVVNNMVLGIDEYLPEDRRNQEVEFIAFKKYYQRIYKQTGCQYKRWVDTIKNDYYKDIERMNEINSKKGASCIEFDTGYLKTKYISLKHNIYIFGHSLDVTDGDVLRELILSDNARTIIFYPDKEEMGRKIANLVKIIGQDELIRRTRGNTKTIEFREQRDARRQY